MSMKDTRGAILSTIHIVSDALKVSVDVFRCDDCGFAWLMGSIDPAKWDGLADRMSCAMCAFKQQQTRARYAEERVHDLELEMRDGGEHDDSH